MWTLLIRLAGPLQSWGTDSKFEIRKTDPMPSKSAVIGLLAAALGRRRDEGLEDLNTLKFGVRVDQPGKIDCDFQMAKTTKTSYLIRRYYIEDGVFLAGFEGDDEELLAKLNQALHHPVFHLYLGRKSCPPTLPLSLGIRKKPLIDALSEEPWQVSDFRKSDLSDHVEIIMENDDPSIRHGLKKDAPISFNPIKREFGQRMVISVPVIIAGHDDSLHVTEHDAFEALEDM